MKRPRSKYFKIALIVVISAAVLYAIMSIIDNIGLVWESVGAAFGFIKRILSPVIIGFIVAFLLHRPSDFFARLLQKSKAFAQRKRLSVVLGVFITFVLFLAFLTAFFYLLIPSLIDSIKSLSTDVPRYADDIYTWTLNTAKTPVISSILDFLGIKIPDSLTVSELIVEYWTELTSLMQSAAAAGLGFVLDAGRFVYNFVLGMFFTVYMLLYKGHIKEQLKTLGKSVFKGFYYKLAFTYKVADDMFYKFIAGKGICSIAIGIATFVICAIMGFKYVPLISLIVAVTNMIPTFGPFIGAIPAALLATMTSPIYGLYMIIIIIVLQVIEGNIIAPRILGSALGLNGFWIIFSIVIMGALFGLVGMLVAAPLFGLIRILLKNWIVIRDKDYEKLPPEEEYAASMKRYKQWTAKKIKNIKPGRKKNA